MGLVLKPNDEDYKASIRLFNGMIDKNPELVFICEEEADIKDAINYARRHSKTISVLSGGHNISGRAVSGEVVISVRNMRRIKVIPEESIAVCEPGVTWSIFDKNTYHHGLVCTGGTVSSTGITGLTLGGGIGWLHGNLGATSDNVREFEIFDYLGQKLICNAEENVDLFWALRGGALSIGVVSKISYNLHRIRRFAAYNCLMNFELFNRTKDFYLKITQSCSNKLTFFLSFLTTRDGEKMISFEISFSNFEENECNEFDEIIAKLNVEFKGHIKDEKRFEDYVQFQSFFDNDKKYGMRSYWKSLIKQKLRSIDWENIRREFSDVPSKFSALFLERYHGKMSQIPIDNSAFSRMPQSYGILITSTWESKEDDGRNIQWSKNFYSTLVEENDTTYINYLENVYPNVSELSGAFGLNKLEKMRKIIKRYDPQNLFINPIINKNL